MRLASAATQAYSGQSPSAELKAQQPKLIVEANISEKRAQQQTCVRSICWV
jgi:hypothetical protein